MAAEAPVQAAETAGDGVIAKSPSQRGGFRAPALAFDLRLSNMCQRMRG